MFRNIAALIVGFVMYGSLAFAAGNPQVTVMIYNDAGVDRASLKQGLWIAEKIYEQAGIAILWQDCTHASLTASETCSVAPGVTSFTVRIVERSLNLPGEAFGIAFVGENGLGQQADIFYSGIEQMGSPSPAFAGRLLGHVMAHELGHLLLGVNSHSRFGLMQARWTDTQLRLISSGILAFDKGQSEVIQARLLGPYAALGSGAGAPQAVSITRASWLQF